MLPKNKSVPSSALINHVNCSEHSEREISSSFFFPPRSSQPKKKNKTGFVIRVNVLNQLTCPFFSLNCTIYSKHQIWNRYIFSSSKGNEKKNKKKHNTHLHIYRFADVTLTSWYTGPGERHAACAKAKNGQVWYQPPTKPVRTIDIYTHTHSTYTILPFAWWTLSSNGINTILMFIL